MAHVCASGVQLVCRRLWPTLASSASTLALFGAANWGLAHCLDSESFMEQLLLHTLFAFAMPLFPLQVSFKNALTVWSMKQSILNRVVAGRGARVDKGSITILSVCPLYIEAPWSAISTDDRLLGARGYSLVGDPKDLCPVELAAPATSSNTDQQLQDGAGHDNRKKYLKLSLDIDVDLRLFKERKVLLQLGMAPAYSQLRFLRSRSRFQAVITGLQAGGYLFGVLQRLAQHLAVCPLEAFVCFLGVIIILQLLVELYACSHYQRPLLLRLNQDQFSQFWNAARDDPESSSYRRCIERFSNYIPFFTVSLVLVILFAGLSITYSVHYMHSCHLCSVAALLFLFALVSLAIVLLLFIKLDDSIFILLGLFWIFSAVIFFCSFMLAVVSTANHWNLFHSPTNNSFSWILPHVSSQA